jgi:hypothetical protein
MGQTIPYHADICGNCRHYTGIKEVPDDDPDIEAEYLHFCKAFTDGEGIPKAILRGENAHTAVFAGDGGIAFAKK